MCLFPIKAWRVADVETGEVHIDFKYVKPAVNVEEISLPCGKCVECLTSYSNQWASRCMLEASLYTSNCMITLTYADAPYSVSKRDLQLFIKRLRKHVEPLRIRYFACGEYGKKGGRAHYHIIVFGWRPSDLEVFFTRDKHNVYKSAEVSKLWSFGFISVEDVTLDSARYCAKYLQKLQDLPPGKLLPFTLMSLKPGIGFGAFNPDWLVTDKMYISGRTYSIPRYYRRKFYGDFSEQCRLRKLRGKLLNSTLLERRKVALQKFSQIKS